MRYARLAGRVFAGAAAFFFIIAIHAQTSPTRLPVEVFGQLPQIRQPALSPDGKHLATIQAYKGRPVAVIRTLDPAGVEPVIIPYDNGYIVDVQWANNNRLLVTINTNAQVWGDSQVNPWYRTASIDATGHNPVIMFSDKRDARAINRSTDGVVDVDLDDPDNVYMALWASANNSDADASIGAAGNVRNSLFLVNTDTGHSQRAFLGGDQTAEWFMDGHGHPVARIDQSLHPLKDHLLLYQPDESWKEVYSVDASDGYGMVIDGLTEDGSALVETVTQGKLGIQALVTKTLPDLKEKALFSDKHYDVSGALTDPWTGRVIGVTVIKDQTTDYYFDPKLEALQRGLDAALPGFTVHAIDWDLDLQKVIVVASSPKQPPAYFLLDRTTHHLILLGRSYEGIQATDLGEMKPYNYKARDGVEIPAYLTLPPGKEAKNLPVVIVPHGGPMDRDYLHFDFVAQFLANRGYAVLQPNFRGSSGYGRAFEAAGYGQWGLKMQDDVTDGVKKLIADGIADPKRICIFGMSYGGYAALAGATFTPNLYACAASWAGPSDLRRMLASDTANYGSQSSTMSAWRRFLGAESGLDAVSPALHADKVKIPVLLMHGEDDATVLINQSEEMEEALQHAGKKVTFISIPKETHYLQSASSRIKVLAELGKFLKENIGD